MLCVVGSCCYLLTCVVCCVVFPKLKNVSFAACCLLFGLCCLLIVACLCCGSACVACCVLFAILCDGCGVRCLCLPWVHLLFVCCYVLFVVCPRCVRFRVYCVWFAVCRLALAVDCVL